MSRNVDKQSVMLFIWAELSFIPRTATSSPRATKAAVLSLFFVRTWNMQARACVMTGSFMKKSGLTFAILGKRLIETLDITASLFFW